MTASSSDTSSISAVYTGIPATLSREDSSNGTDVGLVGPREHDEDLLLVTMEEQSPASGGGMNSTDPRCSRGGLIHSSLGLLMTSATTSLGLLGASFLAGQYLDSPEPFSILVYAGIMTLWYITVHTVSWKLFELICRAFMYSSRHESRMFVDSVMQHSTIWNYVGCVMAVVFCFVVIMLGWYSEALPWSDKNTTRILLVFWAVFNISLVGLLCWGQAAILRNWSTPQVEDETESQTDKTSSVGNHYISLIN